MSREHDDVGRPALDDELRTVLSGTGEPSFDYDALVAGTLARARRIRRRRTVARAAVAAVMVPGLVGGGWLVGNRLSVDGGPEPEVTVATQTERPDDAAPTTAPADDAATTAPGDAADLTVPVEDATTTAPDDGGVTTGPPVADGPPYQDQEPPEPPDGTEEGSLPNRIEIPDPRPTGVDLLDELGAPQLAHIYPRGVPLMGFLRGNEVPGDEPHSSRYWSYFDPAAGMSSKQVEIVLTAWDDSTGPMAQLRDEGSGYAFDWVGLWGDGPSEEEPLPVIDRWSWTGHEDDAGRLLLTQQESGVPGITAGAVIRQGDYLVGVTVITADQDESVAAATEIAEKSAANLAHLDPDHGQD